MRILVCCATVLLGSLSLFAQKVSPFRMWEDSLVSLRAEVMAEPDETTRLSLNEDFMTLLEEVLTMPGSFNYTWDSVKNFSVLASPDKLFKIFTWFVLKEDYSAENFGFIQVYNQNRKKYVLFPLYDKRGSINYPKTVVGNHNRWYGAVYYKMIPVKSKDFTYYTLLGWNGNDLFTNQKIIEVLHFSKETVPVFGARIFKNYPEKVSRIILEYSKEATLHLGYEEQQYRVRTGKLNPKTHEPEYNLIHSPMIIFEEIIPLEENVQNIPAYMVPESSLHHGLVEKNGKWLFMKDVRGTNPDRIRPPYQYKNRQFYNPHHK
jgi:hypothetical protein